MMQRWYSATFLEYSRYSLVSVCIAEKYLTAPASYCLENTQRGAKSSDLNPSANPFKNDRKSSDSFSLSNRPHLRQHPSNVPNSPSTRRVRVRQRQRHVEYASRCCPASVHVARALTCWRASSIHEPDDDDHLLLRNSLSPILRSTWPIVIISLLLRSRALSFYATFYATVTSFLCVIFLEFVYRSFGIPRVEARWLSHPTQNKTYLKPPQCPWWLKEYVWFHWGKGCLSSLHLKSKLCIECKEAYRGDSREGGRSFRKGKTGSCQVGLLTLSFSLINTNWDRWPV